MLCILHQNSHFFHPQTTLIRKFFITFARSCSSVARSLRSLSAPGPLQKTLVARVPCSFCLQGPVYINDRMHHTFNFLNLMCYLLSSSCQQYSTHMFFVNFLIFFTNLLPALGGEHDFESCMYVKSSKNVPLSTPSYTKSHRKILSWGHLLQVKMYKFPLKNQHFLIMAFLGCVFRVPPVVPCLLAFLESPFLSKFAGFFQKVLPALGGEHIF